MENLVSRPVSRVVQEDKVLNYDINGRIRIYAYI